MAEDALAEARAYMAGKTAVAPPPPAAPRNQPPPVEEPESTEPRGVVEIILPSGIELYFQEHPKRLYRARLALDVEGFDPPADSSDDFREWRELVSCSTITKILDKPGLVHWGETGGIEGVQELVKRGYISEKELTTWSSDAIKEIMKQKKLTAYHRRDKAGTRGTSVHKALEGWAMSGDVLDPGVFPPEEQGYVIGLNRWINESGFVPLKSEVMVASLIHGTAGRFDLMGKIPEPVKISTHLTRAGNEKRETIQPDTFLVDLKTSSGVYEEYHLQVAGYQGICLESGYERPNQTAILRVSSDGKYEFVQGVSEWLDFWFCKGLYDALAGIKERAR